MLTPDQLDRVYAAIPGLRLLNTEYRASLEAVMACPVIKRDASIYRQGDTNAQFVLCLSGGMSVMATAPGGRKLLLLRIEAGSPCPISIASAMRGGPYAASATAASSDCECILVPQAAFQMLFDISADFRRFVMSAYLGLMPRVLNLLDQLAFSRVDQRLASSLLAQASPTGHVARTHREIAIDIGTVREIVSHQLSDWADAGWVKTMRGNVQVLNSRALSGFLTAPAHL